MYYLTTLCCTCLKKADKLINLADKDSNGLQYIQQFELCSFSIIFQNMDLKQPLCICESCCKYLKITHKFIKMCRQNCKSFRRYVDQLKSVSAELPNSYFDINVEISGCDTEKCVIFESQISNQTDNCVRINTSDDDCSKLASIINTNNLSEITLVRIQTAGVTNSILSENTNRDVEENCDLLKTVEDAAAAPPFAHRIYEDTFPFNSEMDKENAAIEWEEDKIDLKHSKEVYDQMTTNFAFETFAEMQQNAEVLVSNNNFKGFPSSNPVHLESEQKASDPASKTSGAKIKAKKPAASTKVKPKFTTSLPVMVCCQYCNKPVSKQNYKRHLFIHSRIRPYKCEACARSFMRSDHLRKHMQHTHADIGPVLSSIDTTAITKRHDFVRQELETGLVKCEPVYHACPKCQKVFGSKQSLHGHMGIHGRRPC